MSDCPNNLAEFHCFVRWSEAESIGINTAQQLEDTLDRLDTLSRSEGRPMLVEVVRDAGDSLSIGVGLPSTLLDYIPASGDPPFYISLGDEEKKGMVNFYYYGDLSEFPNKFLVPTDEARKALRHFVCTGELSQTLKWEEG